MKESTGQYRCDNCDEVWDFFPEDYASLEDWPSICPLCMMPISQLIADSYREGGLIEILRNLKLRFL
jgi:hypothetical protein